MPTPTIKKPNQHFDATLWTGNGTSQTITNAGGFQPDFVWAKTRSAISSNLLYDSIRGVNQYLSSNQTAAEATLANSLTAFNSNGFTVGSDSNINGSGVTNVGWQWKAGGASTVNTSGSISSNVSVNATAGFSVVTYTGTGANATVGHGLGVSPKMVITKQRNTTRSWYVYHASLASAANYLVLDSTAAAGSDTTLWNNTAPTSSVFSLGANIGGNQSTGTYVAYCFAEVEGYSKFGSYTGNASADGPFLYTGFRPKFILIKGTAANRNWVLFDSSRNTYNASANLARLKPNTSDAEDGNEQFDFLSNGFKIRNYTFDGNASGETYIYMAFAESPFKYSNAR